MVTFVDTSAWYALLDEDDGNHAAAAEIWRRVLREDRIVTHAFVVIESSALVQRRLGIDAARHLHRTLLPVAEVKGIGDQVHASAVERWLAAGRRHLSLVDVTSFMLMERSGIPTAFAFDDDFVDAGFSLRT